MDRANRERLNDHRDRRGERERHRAAAWLDQHRDELAKDDERGHPGEHPA
jgi:hypothetical protein